MDKISDIKELVMTLNQHRHEYYNLNAPIISDAEYDELFDKLKQLEQETGFILSCSPTQNVGYEVVSKFEKVQHKIPLLSLEKTKSLEALQTFINNWECIIMLKNDGLTIKLEYEDGNLVRGSTRGNGLVGEDVTHNVKTFKYIPLSIPYKGKLTVVGEAIIHRGDFEKINENLPLNEKKYKTPRNLVAGSVRQQDSKVCAEREVCFHAFGILESDMELPDSKYERFGILSDLGFLVVGHMKLLKDYAQEGGNLQTYVDIMRNMADELGIPIDGLVITYDSVEYSDSLGSTSHHPLHSCAYKFEDESAETTLTDIEWSVGRIGTITPVAIFESVDLDGTEVTRASLHNLSIIEELQLGVGDTIKVIKSNQIIPQVVGNLTCSNNIEIPKTCPSCNQPTEIEQLNESKVLKCVNPKCPEKLLARFVHFVSRNAMNIEGLSEATLEKFIEKGILKRFDDIYDIKEHKETIIKMDGFGKKSFDKLVESVEKSRNVKMENYLYALGIPNIGRSASKTIARCFNNDGWDFERAIVNGFDFTQLEDFGEVMHDSLYNWYNDELEKQLWQGLTLSLKFTKDEPKEEMSNLKDLTGLTFVITGSVNTYKNRDEFKELVESLGGKISGSVSKNTNFLISSEDSDSSKSKKAAELGVKVITELEFNEMIGRVV